MDRITGMGEIKPDFGGSFAGKYKLFYNQKKEYEVEFVWDMRELIESVPADELIIEAWAMIKERHNLPEIDWILLTTEFMSLRFKEKDFDKISIYGSNEGSEVLGVQSRLSFIHVKIITKKKQIKKNEGHMENALAKLNLN
jgi:hypothetical protein